MISPPEKDVGWFLLFLYALAAITGGLGGCAVWARHVGVAKRASAFVLAYTVVGVVVSVVTISILLLMSSNFTVVHAVLYGIMAGVGGAFGVFGVNWGAGVAFRYRNFEARFTLRRPEEDRRWENSKHKERD